MRLISIFALILSVAIAAAQGKVRYPFDEPKDLAGWSLQATGDAGRRMPKPKIEDKRLVLLEAWGASTGAIAAKPPTDKLAQTVDLSWKLNVDTGTEGTGFLWLDIAKYGDGNDIPDVGAWEEPSVARAFGVGFDASDPPNRDPFRGSGNIMDRPQHEVSLHWDNVEIVKKLTQTEFRDGKDHDVRLRIAFVTGGAEVTLRIDRETVYDRYFIPSMTAFVGRPAFGARNADSAGDVALSDLSISWTKPIEVPGKPLTVTAIDHVLNDKDHGTNSATVDFPADSHQYGRIVCTLRLDKPTTRFDPWDRIATVSVVDDQGQSWEVLRYITPYGRGYVWQVDVSDFRPLLTGRKQIVQACGTQGEGWVVSVTFDFYPGPADRYATKLVRLWSGAPEIGNPDKPVESFYVPRDVPVERNADFAAVRTVVTGHGMEPNSQNAGEFMPIWRTLTVDGDSFRNLLWKTDNYLNPCRPQGGTWKYDRAGWGPGCVVEPWEVDISNLLRRSDTLHIRYALDNYINYGRGKTWAPTHVTESYLVFYRR
ncbi:MAG TPA: peptide-N-glycosidase F-related protein [Fimbriimonadaceae bacterium]|nr:peptide-N-glycosidase F-related protein [Fimbriimonadaceae bacterium]